MVRPSISIPYIESLLNLSHHAISLFFTHKIRPDLHLFNTTLRCLSLRRPDLTLSLFNAIQISGLRPDTYSFPAVLKAAARLRDVGVGRRVHGQAIRVGFGWECNVATGVIQMYGTCGCVGDARKVFDEMCKWESVVLWNAMVAVYTTAGDVVSARQLFDIMPQRNVISWTTMIAGYVQVGKPNGAIEIFKRMQLQNVEPDEVTILAVLSACADLGALELGKWVHNLVDKLGLRRSLRLNNALVDLYVKSGLLEKALEVFESMEKKSVVSWTTMIAGLAFHGRGREAMVMFSRVQRAQVKPNEITFIALLSACSHAGLVELGQYYFTTMSLEYGIKPKIQHYGCMVDLLARVGHLKEAEDLVSKMPYEPNAAIWGSLLAACHIHGDAELAAKALERLSKMEPNNSGNYSLLCNIYSSLGMWKEAGIARKRMRELGVKKTAGESCIEVDKRVHCFISGEESHPRVKEVYEILCQINWECRMESNVTFGG